jgi:nitronate monooxygenase
MNIPQLKIAHMTPKVPIMQGGMGIAVSLSSLASAVSNAGGIGIISGTGIPIPEMVAHIRKARELANGVSYIGVNVLFAMSDFANTIKAAMEEKVDFIISGAGISRDMYQWGRDYGVPIISIVSSGKLARISQKLGAAAVVVEGFEAGGHLGTDRPLFDIIPEVLEAVDIPVIAAGGILTGEDIAKVLQMGVSGVQMGTRFVASVECDAPDAYKQKYLDCKEGDTVLVKTTVGLHGRAIKNRLVERVNNLEKIYIEKCTACLKHCNHQFCTADKLVEAVRGDIEDGLVFAGARVHEIKDILPVQVIIDNLMEACKKQLAADEIATS